MVILYGEIIKMSKFDTQALEQLVYDFYNLTNIKCCIYDSNENELCFYPTKYNNFCEILHEDEKMAIRCKECDHRAFSTCRNTRRQYMYTCHAGLKECVSPIFHGNDIIGFIMIGQTKVNHDDSFSKMSKNLPESLKRILSTAYIELPLIEDEKLISATHILEICASHEFLKTLNLIYEYSIEQQITKYLLENISKPLTVSHLCSKFHMSHYEIHNVFNEYFGCAPTKYIKKFRLDYACTLLTTTNLPVNKIAVKCGIEDYNYFSKIFKSTYDISPTVYRKNAKS